MGRSLLIVTFVACQAAPLMAQRREGTREQPLWVTFPEAAVFQNVTLPPRRYRVSVAGVIVSLVNPRTMVTEAQLTAEESVKATDVTTTVVQLLASGDDLTLEVKQPERILSVRGKKTQLASKGSNVQLAQSKSEHAVQAQAAQEHSDRENVERAMQRYLSGIKHCADRVQQQRWQTDDPRFEKCVCPQVLRWRLPKVQAVLRLHVALAPGQSGVSLSATPEGKAISCRVWVGPRSPELPEPESPTAEPSGAASP